jgi:hypothetical protein
MMSQTNNTPLNSIVDAEGRQASLIPGRPIVAADRLYQLAALTAGIILLATLL